jgi:hypothetical protein
MILKASEIEIKILKEAVKARSKKEGNIRIKDTMTQIKDIEADENAICLQKTCALTEINDLPIFAVSQLQNKA